MSNYKGGVKNRRTRALARLEKQLQSGTKTVTVGLFKPEQHPLTDKDKVRITKDIETLKSRI